MATTARDIPKSYGRDSFTAVAARSVPVNTTKVNYNLPLPTPPNSISPSLPPHSLKARASGAGLSITLDAIESDLDLHESSPGCENLHQLDAAGAITSTLLAKHHLPGILLDNGPLAIRHIMACLATSVPGFSGIAPNKARRIVVAALEGRGTGGEGGGLNGDVRFEKVGWGRWHATKDGHVRADQHQSYPMGIPIHKAGGRLRANAPASSWAGDSAVFSHDDDTDVNMLEDQADRMSLDGDEPCSSSEGGPEEDEVMVDNEDTDDEDWAAVGAAALRSASYSASGPGRKFFSHVYTGGSCGGGGPSLSALAQSVPLAQQQRTLNFTQFGMASDSQEREAIEALLRLGSV